MQAIHIFFFLINNRNTHKQLELPLFPRKNLFFKALPYFFLQALGNEVTMQQALRTASPAGPWLGIELEPQPG